MLFHISWVMVKMLCLIDSLHVKPWIVQGLDPSGPGPCLGLV
ncbi:hypothetical protein SynNOUM97013_01821 [Synechococcus sp. NOUM97013]|nr:hypothetical protein SynNOUM97013_01821 [Synechococcus sp. NOUM97013]